jgi:molybdopterin converting factor small subunit
MTLNVLFFAQAREQAGCSSAAIDLPAGAHVRDALDAIVGRYPGLAPLRGHFALSLDGVLVRGDEPVPERAELALLPPVSGG